MRLDFGDEPVDDPGDRDHLARLAAARLHPAELAAWRALGAARRKREWLMGRLAARDAVRHTLEAAGRPAGRGDALSILPDAWGRPLAAGPAGGSAGSPLAVSIAHTRGIAVAIAAETTDGLGIDIERIDRRRGDYERAAFSDEERRRLDAGPGDRRTERALRLFCAKEAVAKAIGRGLMGSPLNLRVADSDTEVTRASLEVAGSLARALPAFRGRRLAAWIGAHGAREPGGTEAGLIVAWARCEAPPAP